MEDIQHSEDQLTPARKSSTMLIVLALLLTAGGFWYYTQGQTPSTTNQEASVSPLAQQEATEQSDDVQVITVEGGSFYYEPAKIELKKGTKVRLVFNSVDMMHDFVIDELGVKTKIIKSGTTDTVEFTVDQVGQFEYYCSVGEHRAQGMVGTLVVTE